MHKIANTNELQTELRRLLAYSQSERPARARIASALESLSKRVEIRRASEALKWVGRKDQDSGDWGSFFEEFTREFDDASTHTGNAATYINIAMKQCSQADHDLRRNSGGGRLGLKGEQLEEYVGEQLSRMEDALDVAHKKLRESLSQVERLQADLRKAKSA